VVSILLALLAPALATEHRIEREGNSWVDESSGTLPSDKALEVTRFVGSVHIASGAPSGAWMLRVHTGEAVEQNARRQFSNFHLGVSRKGNATLIQTVGPVDLALRAELIIQLPAGAESVHVDTMGGKITVSGKMRSLDLQAHGGDIEIDDADQLRAMTMGGSVTVNHRLGDSYIRAGGGDIRVDASVGDMEIFSMGGNILLKAIARGRVQSEGGNIEVVHCMGELLVRTAGGNINLGQMDGTVRADSGGGSIRVGVAHGMVMATTAYGNIELWKLSQGAVAHSGLGRITAEFVGDRNSMRDSELATTMGDIVAYFSPQVPGNIRAITGACPARKIVSDFSSLKVFTGLAEYGPRSVAAFGAIHGGGPTIELRTMTGQIELREIQVSAQR
jgi:hypothetical protein